MKVLIVSPYRTVAPHFEHELELAQRHLDCGDEVSFLSCHGELPNCDFNPGRDPQTCHECRLRRQHGLQQLSGRVSQACFADRRPGRGSCDPADSLSLAGLSGIEALKSIKVANFDIGFATLSSLVSHTRDPEVDLAGHARELRDFSTAALTVYRSMLQRLSRQRPDRVYVFNGRFAAMRGVLRACQRAGVECLIHERGSDTRHYQLFRSRLPHDIEYIDGRMREHWQGACGQPDREKRAAAWFHGRVRRVEKNWRSFVKGQQRGRLPAGWDADRHNVVIFTSSEDEFVAIGDSWSDRLYADQGEGIHALAVQLMRERPNAMLTVRMHPNLTGIDNASTRRLAALDLANVRVIPPQAKIDSYQLMRVADTVATFGSSIGIEAVFWSKPSVLVGPCFYQQLRGPQRVRDHQQAVRLLAADLLPATRHEALIYGYWQETHGILCRYFQPDDNLFTGRFRGQVVYPRPPESLGRRLSRPVRSLRQRLRPSRRRRAA
jgi:hypothetical protein